VETTRINFQDKRCNRSTYIGSCKTVQWTAEVRYGRTDPETNGKKMRGDN